MKDIPTQQENLADTVVIYGRGREIFRPPMCYKSQYAKLCASVCIKQT